MLIATFCPESTIGACRACRVNEDIGISASFRNHENPGGMNSPKGQVRFPVVLLGRYAQADRAVGVARIVADDDAEDEIALFAFGELPDFLDVFARNIVEKCGQGGSGRTVVARGCPSPSGSRCAATR